MDPSDHSGQPADEHEDEHPIIYLSTPHLNGNNDQLNQVEYASAVPTPTSTGT